MRFILFLSFLIPLNSFSQNVTTKIDGIFSIAKQINADLNTYTKIEKYKDSISSKNFYTLNDTIQKIEISTSENETLKIVNWYYLNSNLIYIEQLWLKAKSFKIIDSEKIIIQNNKIIAWLNTNNQLIDFNTNEYNQLCLKIVEYGLIQKNLLQE